MHNRHQKQLLAAAGSGLTAELIRDLLAYDAETGELTWKQAVAGRPAGSRAGCVKSDGRYVQIRVNGRNWKAHRIIWLHYYGVWPDYNIDHVNCDGCDNRIANLREADHRQNAANLIKKMPNKTGFTGVSKTRSGRYTAHIHRYGKSNALGTFDTPEQARAAYVNAAKQEFGEFFRN